MDTEVFNSLVLILVWGALFLLMMRFGCGAHINGPGGSWNAGERIRDGESPHEPGSSPIVPR